jgi:indolepyruvate ferredoxin oxidoreductase alpha subunit
MERRLLSGDEAVAAAARDGGVHLGTGYPGTPSTEILEAFSALGGRAQWAPNEKVALEVGIGAAFAGARAIVTMKHVGLNVAADPLFTAAYTGVSGALVVVAADDPGMASSQNEQDSPAMRSPRACHARAVRLAGGLRALSALELRAGSCR